MLMILEVLDVAVNIKYKSGTKIIFDSHEDWPMMESVQNWFIGESIIGLNGMAGYIGKKTKILTAGSAIKLIGKVDALLTVSDELALPQIRKEVLCCIILNYWKL